MPINASQEPEGPGLDGGGGRHGSIVGSNSSSVVGVEIGGDDAGELGRDVMTPGSRGVGGKVWTGSELGVRAHLDVGRRRASPWFWTQGLTVAMPMFLP